MRFAMEAQTLNEAIVSVIKALPVRAAMPVLDGIYICADANGVRIIFIGMRSNVFRA